MRTGDAEIVEDSAFDTFWGVGGDGTGLNWLGRILMETRTALVAEASANSTATGNLIPSL